MHAKLKAERCRVAFGLPARLTSSSSRFIYCIANAGRIDCGVASLNW